MSLRGTDPKVVRLIRGETNHIVNIFNNHASLFLFHSAVLIYQRQAVDFNNFLWTVVRVYQHPGLVEILKRT
ncbi:hypothetical protein Y032_0580g248 [Ancylostoma ceylanicum]|uniref:Uncharacterized protein n=1 Tax=Ancylostoma ceylanicum TaxID=53326 RepID=A0A016WNB7_9BILA|nr:hypothetical protein Y032_0580g248 [Ancylostoma ceylanicum]